MIERTEEDFTTRRTVTVAANDWLERRDPWEARVGGDMVLTCAYDEASENSRCRRETIDSFEGSLAREPFGWLKAPVHNRYTRLAAELCPARGIVRVMGLDQAPDDGPAQQVTQICEVTPPALAA